MDASIKVILSVKSKPELYDVTHPDYGNKRHHTYVWKELAKKMGVRVDHLKAKWNSLRNSYARTIRPEILDPNAPEKSWYLKPHMNFLRPHVAHKIQRSKYLEKIRNGEIVDDNGLAITMTDLNDETTQDFDDSKTETYNSSLMDDALSCYSDNDEESGDIENQPIDFLETMSHDLTTVHDFTVIDDKNHHQQQSLNNSKENDISEPKDFDKELNNLNTKLTNCADTVNYNIDKPFLGKNENANDKSCSNRYNADKEYDCVKRRRSKLKKVKREKVEKYDKIVDILTGYCADQIKAVSEAKSDNLFFQSIICDFEKLSDKKKRKFKSRILSELNDLLDESEIDLIAVNRNKA